MRFGKDIDNVKDINIQYIVKIGDSYLSRYYDTEREDGSNDINVADNRITFIDNSAEAYVFNLPSGYNRGEISSAEINQMKNDLKMRIVRLLEKQLSIIGVSDYVFDNGLVKLIEVNSSTYVNYIDMDKNSGKQYRDFSIPEFSVPENFYREYMGDISKPDDVKPHPHDVKPDLKYINRKKNPKRVTPTANIKESLDDLKGDLSYIGGNYTESDINDVIAQINESYVSPSLSGEDYFSNFTKFAEFGKDLNGGAVNIGKISNLEDGAIVYPLNLNMKLNTEGLDLKSLEEKDLKEEE